MNLLNVHRLLLLLLFSLGYGVSYTQTITGVVKEKGSGLPLPFANVFINNTTLGAATDMDGKFVIQGNLPEQLELVASFVGYRTVSKVINRKGQSEFRQDFELELIEDNLNEVELKAKRDRNWERNYATFKYVFLAVPEDPYGQEIEILNPWVIDFERVRSNDELNYIRASAQQPLKIVNRALGYEIEYFLQDFRMRWGASRYYGLAFYKEMATEDSTFRSKWREGRLINYRSSVRHMALSFLLKNPEIQDFNFYQARATIPKEDRTNDYYYELGKSIFPVNVGTIYTKPLGNGSYRIYLPERIEVHHLAQPWTNDYYANIYKAISWIATPNGYFDVDRYGAPVNPTQVVLSGYVGRQRMARSLPLDFVPDVGLTEFVEDLKVFHHRYVTLNNQREKPWLTTNKAFYHPGETMWIGGLMLYQNPVMQDTLSRVVYVNVLNEEYKSVHQARFSIQNGKISGGITLPDSLRKGNYLLRAYTRWSLNYGKRDVFELPFPILNTNEILAINEPDQEKLFGDFDVVSSHTVSDSSFYRVMDLELKVLDDFENPIDSEFILSVVEGSQSQEVHEKDQLESHLNWLEDDLANTFDSEMPNPIEYGISVEGKYFPNKKRGTLATVITLVKGDLEDYGRVNSDSAGRFWASGFQFRDTAQIAIAALDPKMRSLGKVELIPFQHPIFLGTFPKRSYQVEIRPDSAHSMMDIAEDYYLLDEFVKEAQELKPQSSGENNYGYGTPTQEVGPDRLERQTMGEILGYLGFNLNTFKFRNYNFLETVGMPLLIIDGVQLAFLDTSDFRNTLLDFEPSQLESIKVYSDNVSKTIFGMAGYAGVIMIETKKGFRTGPDSDRKFNSEGFQIVDVAGFSSFPEFPKDHPSDQFLSQKPTIYWEPNAQTVEGVYKTKIKVPYGVKLLRIRVEGRTMEGDSFSKMLKIEI